MIRAVLDTNVLISSIIGDGVPAEIVRKARSGMFALVLSAYILEEARRVMIEKLQLDALEVETVLQGRASILVTGDKRFLATSDLPVDVVTPTEFMRELESERV